MGKKKNSEAGKNRAAARQVNKEYRERVAGMTSQQLKGFFGGFEAADLGRIEKAIAAVHAESAKARISEIDEAIKALEAERDSLK
tara:strand:- start:453 stop:707 length:255 start_codon:yes stop_codon:yes gene_type:complete